MEFGVHSGAEKMHDDLVHFLGAGGRGGVNGDRLVDHAGQRVRLRPRQRPDVKAAPPPLVGGPQEVTAGAAGGQQHKNVPCPAVGADLPGEDLVITVVVADGGDGRHVGVQGGGRERDAVVAVPPDQFGRQMLGMRGASTVARRQQPGASGEHSGQLGAPPLGGIHLGTELFEHGDQCRHVRASYGCHFGPP
ncbi:hypothetical protein BJF79_07090 [Actinomadura sp. CNU-125]|nr:hypothetical protein BJF79_07090 [Actinomadura sp. CNU-125]